MTASDHEILRRSLVFVWLATALASVIEINGQSTQLLIKAGLQKPVLVNAVILGGASTDAILGMLIWLRPVRTIYWAALAAMCLMTIIATVLDPSLWLHPLGPLTKNVPIAAALFILARART